MLPTWLLTVLLLLLLILLVTQAVIKVGDNMYRSLTLTGCGAAQSQSRYATCHKLDFSLSRHRRTLC